MHSPGSYAAYSNGFNNGALGCLAAGLALAGVLARSTLSVVSSYCGSMSEALWSSGRMNW